MIPALFELYGVERPLKDNKEYDLESDAEVFQLISEMIDSDPSKGVRAFKLVLKEFCPWVAVMDDKTKLSDFDIKEAFRSFNVEI